MMKLFLPLMLLIFISTSAIAQLNNGAEEKISKINLLYPSYEQEFRITPKLTWGYRAGLNTYFEFGKTYTFVSGTTTTKYFELVPTGEVFCKWYYRLLKRQEKNRKTINNSAGYFFSGARIFTPGIKIVTENNSGVEDVISGIYAGWGFRRTIGQNLSFDLTLQYEVLMRNLEEVKAGFIIPGFKLGYTINKKKQ